MTHNSDSGRPSPLNFPEGLTADQKAARWAELLAHAERVSDADLDEALYQLLCKSRRGI
jgi:hypothetical protein